jgi:hypothetical protein
MLTKAAALFAIIPPSFAILVELLNPISEKLLRRSIERDLEGYETTSPDAHELLLKRATSLACGAIEVSGLAPTLVAAVSSGFGVLYEYPNPSLIVTYVLIFIALILFLLRYLGGYTFFEINDSRPSFTFAWWEFDLNFRGSSVVSFLIYLANGLLIAFVGIVYYLLGRPEVCAAAP